MRYFFADNEEYNAEDLKTALGVMAAKSGLAIDLSDGETYDPSALNQLIGAAVCEGVLPGNSSFRVDKSGDGYIVNPGRAVFSDGGVAVLEEAETVNAVTGQYVALTYSFAEGVAVSVGSSAFSEGDGVFVVPLAYINADGSVKDMREFAEGRVPALSSMSWNTLHEESFSVTFPAGESRIEVRHEVSGSFNFMLIDLKGCLNTLRIGKDGSVTLHAVYRFSSDAYGDNSSALAIKNDLSATYVDSGTGYITLRYKRGGSMSFQRTFSYTALFGILSD